MLRTLASLHKQYSLAHLRRRLIGELIVYTGILRPSVIRPSSFSNDISSEAEKGVLFIGERKLCCFFFYPSPIRTLVAMATYSFHRLIMEKSGI